MKKVFTIALVVVLALFFTQVAFAADPQIKVGTLMAHTGPLKEYGPNIKNGAVLAAKQLGEAGLRVRLVHEDSETDPIAGASAAKKLVDIDRVVAIVGALSSGVTLAVAESVTIPNEVIIISPASTNPLMSDLPADRGKDFVFRTCPSDALQGVVAGKKAAEMWDTASVLYVNNAYGQGLAEVFKKAFEANGGKVLEMVPHDEKASESYTAELRRALAGKPGVLCAYSYPEHAKVYLKEAIEFFNYKSFFYCDGTKSFDIINALGVSMVEGQIGTAPGALGGRPLDLFNKAFEKEFGELPPLPFITNAYDGMAVVGLAAYDAIQSGKKPTAKNIRDHLRFVANPPGTKILPGEFKKAFDLIRKGEDINYEGAAGSVDFDTNGDVVTPIEIFKYTRGDIETVELMTP
ncbi:MAG: ABC transporter substrate-binding protein [Spirochaetota bacterium]|nr:MAG: ABC transporter substrate-binding protein [Spirochaetota bacterium]